MFSAVYTSGHLVTAAFSLTMALAFSITSARVPGRRADLWYTATFLLTALGGFVEMALSVRPSLSLARSYLAFMTVLLLFVDVGFFAQYADDVFGAAAKRRHRRALSAYVGLALLMLVGIFGGIFDGGHVNVTELWGARSMMIAVPGWAFATMYLYVACNFALMVPLLLWRGTRREERRVVAIPMMLVPLVALHELLISLGVNRMIPVGGYFSALAGLTGAFVLAERFRALQRGGGVIGRYTNERRLGGGGMADVYLARRSSGGELGNVVQMVALKRLRPEYAADPEFAQMLLDEARIIARLSHPNIVALHDVGREEGELYLAMELVEGVSLSRLLKVMRARRQLCEPPAVVELAVQLCDALAYAHALTGDDGRSLELIHRDVSPQNILLAESGHVKLADFGIARSAGRAAQTATGMMKGKLPYMAPEQIRGAAYDQRIDLYALGVVLFEMATGARPFDDDSDERVMYRILEGQMSQRDRLALVPTRLAAVISLALASDPKERAQSAVELRTLLLPLRDQARGSAQLAELVRLALEAGELPRRDDLPTVANLPADQA